MEMNYKFYGKVYQRADITDLFFKFEMIVI